MSGGRLAVYLLSFRDPVRVGTLSRETRSFSYDGAYLEDPEAVSLSNSLPLSRASYGERDYRPYFSGLIPEGSARDALVAELGIHEGDYLSLLETCGRDCVGDVMIADSDEQLRRSGMSYEPIGAEQLEKLFSPNATYAQENASSRLSLAGTQHKTGLAHLAQEEWGSGWLRPRGLAATTHILKTSYLRDVPEIEFLCMEAARSCGLDVAAVGLLPCTTPVLAVERFDRKAALAGGELIVFRVHQEDAAQALGLEPSQKYQELEGGSIHRIAELVRRSSAHPAGDIAQLAKLVCFNYVIGNCDAHLKNFSFRLGRSEVSLAPAYDLVCTTYFERFSRDLAMRLGGVRAIDNVVPSTFDDVASELGISSGMMRALARPIADGCIEGIVRAGEDADNGARESTAFVAEDLAEDMYPRVEVLRRFCG